MGNDWNGWRGGLRVLFVGLDHGVIDGIWDLGLPGLRTGRAMEFCGSSLSVGVRI